MVIEETLFRKDFDIAPVEQTDCISVSSMLNSGTVPNVPLNDEYAELDHNKIYGRPSDVFDAMGMQKHLISAGQAAAMSDTDPKE